MSYEVTIVAANDPYDHPEFELLADTYGWTTSILNGDSVLGPGYPFCFTCHEDDYEVAFSKMILLSNLLNEESVRVLRLKIAMVVYDTGNLLITSN